MMKNLSALVMLLTISLGFGETTYSQTAPNSTYDDYAPAFRQLPNGGAELWFTSATGSKSGRSRQMMVSRCTVNGFGAPAPLSDANINFVDPTRSGISDVSLNGVPAFTCDGSRGVFVSNRLVQGQDLGNDIYEMIQRADGHWDVVRLDAVNSAGWDDTPSLAPDGSILFFASDRRMSGTRKTDLFYARRGVAGFSAPVALDVVNTEPFSEEAPVVGPDGYFYYSTNASGHFQIWRAPIGRDGLPTTRGVPVPFAGVNSDSSDACHACFSPGGNWFLYCSNRGTAGKLKDEDIYWVRLNNRPTLLSVNVFKRSRKHNPSDISEAFDTTESLPNDPVTLHDVYSNTDLVQTTNQGGSCTFQLGPASDPAADVALRVGLLSAKAPDLEIERLSFGKTPYTFYHSYVSATDTLRYLNDRSNFERTLYVWDTSSYYDPGCKQNFPISKVQFFIEGYWGPTTHMYRHYLPDCPSFFADASCTIPERKCDDDILYGYRYTATPFDVCDTCFNYKEFRSHGAGYAEEVDRTLGNLNRSMESALQRDCVVRAKRKGRKVIVTVTGFTDPLNYRHNCKYTGTSIDFSTSLVQLADTNGQIDQVGEGHCVKGTPIKIEGLGGNRLLSKLRAYYAARLLDGIWSDSVSTYKELRDRGLITIRAVGRNVNLEETTNPAKRSIAVSIETEVDPDIKQGLKPKPGQAVDLWDACKREGERLSVNDSH